MTGADLKPHWEEYQVEVERPTAAGRLQQVKWRQDGSLRSLLVRSRHLRLGRDEITTPTTWPARC